MKISRIYFAFILLCFLIPVMASPLTFDQYGIPKLALFGILIAVSIAIIIINVTRSLLTALPLSVKTALGVFITIQCFQTFRLPNPAGGFFGEYGQSESLLVQLGFIFIFIASYLLFSSGNPLRPFRAAILAVVYIISSYGIFEYFLSDPLTHLPVLRVKSLLGDPNSLGVLLILTLPILFWDMASEKCDTSRSRFRFYLSAFGVFLGVTNLLLTFSRASWLGFSITLLIFMSFLLFKKRNYLNLLKLLCIIIVLAVFCGEGFTQLQPKSHTDYDLNARITSVTEGKDSGRKLLWSTAWTVFKTSPVLGYGMGTFQDTFHRYQTKAAVNNWSPERDIREVHNETLHYLATQGLVGLLSYFGLLFILGYSVWRQRDRRQFDTGRVALISALFGYLVFVQFAYPLLHYSFLFWLYWGILLANPSEKAVVRIKKPSVSKILLIGLLIGGSIGFGYRIYRADALYLKSFSAGHVSHYHQSLRYFPEILSQNSWIYQYRYRYAVTLIRAARQAERKSRPKAAHQYLTKAQSILEALQKSHPSRYQIPFLFGEIWESRRHYSEANICYRRAAYLFPANFKLWYRIAKTDLLLGRKQKAQSAWRIGMNLNPSYMISNRNRDQLQAFENEQ